MSNIQNTENKIEAMRARLQAKRQYAIEQGEKQFGYTSLSTEEIAVRTPEITDDLKNQARQVGLAKLGVTTQQTTEPTRYNLTTPTQTAR